MLCTSMLFLIKKKKKWECCPFEKVGVRKWLMRVCLSFGYRRRIAFLSNLASTAKQQSFGRVGLMALAECIASAACGVGTHDASKAEWCGHAFSEQVQVEFSPEIIPCHDKSDLLDILRFLIESSKQHFNPNYRLRGL